MQCFVGVSKRKQKALSLNEIEGAMQKKCCKANCIQMKLSKSEIMKTRTTFRSLTEEAQRSFILNFFLLSQYHHKGKRSYTFRVNGKNVCRLAWIKLEQYFTNNVSVNCFKNQPFLYIGDTTARLIHNRPTIVLPFLSFIGEPTVLEYLINRC